MGKKMLLPYDGKNFKNKDKLIEYLKRKLYEARRIIDVLSRHDD